MIDRLKSSTESMIDKMGRLASLHNATVLSDGIPDFEPPRELIKAAIEAINHGLNQYSDPWGRLSLRNAIASKVKRFNKIEANPEKHVTVTCGTTEAANAAIIGLTKPGDKIVITDPSYENYIPDATIAGVKLLYVPFVGPELTFDEEKLKHAMSNRPRLIVLNTPHNPTGRVLNLTQLKLVSDLCEEANTVAVVDEIYEHITYDDRKHVSLASIGNMHDRTVTISGASKTYGVTGWRVGWAIADSSLTKAIRKVHLYLTVGAATPFQEAIVTALNFPQKYYDDLAAMYSDKRRQMIDILDRIGLRYYVPEGTFFVLADAPKTFKDAEQFAHHLLKLGVAVLPAAALYHNKRLGASKIRISFCKNDETIREAEGRLMRLKEAPVKDG